MLSLHAVTDPIHLGLDLDQGRTEGEGATGVLEGPNLQIVLAKMWGIRIIPFSFCC